MKNNKKGALHFLYNTVVGRFILKLLTARWLSKLCGAFLSCRLSKPLIKSFVNNNGIDLKDYKSDNFTCKSIIVVIYYCYGITLLVILTKITSLTSIVPDILPVETVKYV